MYGQLLVDVYYMFVEQLNESTTYIIYKSHKEFYGIYSNVFYKALSHPLSHLRKAGIIAPF